jgi:hypothetical protein
MPVGSVFSFIWNGMISTSFQLVGFLLTYLLHSTHAAKNGSRAGLGITLIQYGFYMKGSPDDPPKMTGPDGYAAPPDPNSHDFKASDVTDGPGGGISDGRRLVHSHQECGSVHESPTTRTTRLAEPRARTQRPYHCRRRERGARGIDMFVSPVVDLNLLQLPLPWIVFIRGKWSPIPLR